MNADTLNALSERIIGCGFIVANRLGSGFLEKVYENALAHELRKAGLTVEEQQGVSVTYDDVIVGEYAADLLVEAAVVVELKAVRALDDIHQAQCMNYLRATGMHLCLHLNFGKPRLEIRRIVRNLRSYLRSSAVRSAAERTSPGTGERRRPMIYTNS